MLGKPELQILKTTTINNTVTHLKIYFKFGKKCDNKMYHKRFIAQAKTTKASRKHGNATLVNLAHLTLLVCPPLSKTFIIID